MSPAGTFALAAVTAQLTATVLLQGVRGSWMRWLDSTALVPTWRFFAFGDLEVEWDFSIRDCRDGAPLETWRHVPLSPARRLSHSVWTPRAIEATLTVSAVETLAERAERQGDVDPTRSRSYARLLTRALTEPRAAGATARQFALRRLHYPRPPEIVFTSRLHDIA